MEQETGIGSLYDEFRRGCGAETGLLCPAFRPNSSYRRAETHRSSKRQCSVREDVTLKPVLSRSVRGLMQPSRNEDEAPEKQAVDWITDEVAIGNYLEVLDAALLKHQGFRSVLSLDGTLTEQHAAQFGLSEVVSYRLIDGPGNDLRVFRLAIEDLKRLAASHSPVLVQCHAGRSRSAVVVAAHLMEACGLNPDQAIALVASKREINVTSALVDLLHKVGT